MKTNKINDYKIVPVKSSFDQRPYKYSDIFSMPFNRIFLASKSGSGKTNIIANLLNILADKKHTTIRIFCSTVNTDETWLAIIDELRSNKINVETFTSLECDDDKYSNILDKQIAELKKWIDDEHNKKKYYSLKNQINLCIYVFDDFNDYLHNTTMIDNLLTYCRHLKTSIIISSQYYKRMSTIGRENINILILFANLKNQTLKDIYDEEFTLIPYETFLEIYEDATREKYSFLMINRYDQTDLRRNLNERYEF